VDQQGGGLEQVLRRWARALAVRHEIVVVSYRLGPQPSPSDEPFETVGVDRPADLASVLGALAPDAVSLHNRPQWISQCPRGSVTGVTFHNYPIAWKVAARQAAGTRRVAAHEVALSAVSGALAGAAAGWLAAPAGSVAVTPPSIDPAYLTPRPWHPKRVVLSPNRLLRKKGVLDLLEVAGRCEFRDVTFAVADLISPWRHPTGEHLALRAAVRAVPNAELFAPTTDASELAERYVESAAVTCPVREPEGLGLVALEAQACGVPLVTTDLGGLREATFWPNACVAPGDLDALAAALYAAVDPDQGGAAATTGGATPGATDPTAQDPAAPIDPARSDPSSGPGHSSPRDAVLARHSPEASASAFERWLLGESGREAGRP